MVDCPQFLDGYSAFRDGELEETDQREFEAHLASCSACQRYDAVVAEGVRVLRGLEEIEPSDDFLPRLQHRIYHLEDEARGLSRSASGTSAVLTLAIASMIAIAAWAPVARSTTPLIEMPPVAARAPQVQSEVPSLFRSGPLLAPAATPPAAARASLGAYGAPGNELFFRYSPMGSSFAVQTVASP